MRQAEIRIVGQLDAKWAEWFEGFDLTYTEAGETILRGLVPDQAAFYGVMAKLRDLGVELISISVALPADAEGKSVSTAFLPDFDDSVGAAQQARLVTQHGEAAANGQIAEPAVDIGADERSEEVEQPAANSH